MATGKWGTAVTVTVTVTGNSQNVLLRDPAAAERVGDIHHASPLLVVCADEHVVHLAIFQLSGQAFKHSTTSTSRERGGRGGDVQRLQSAMGTGYPFFEANSTDGGCEPFRYSTQSLPQENGETRTCCWTELKPFASPPPWLLSIPFPGLVKPCWLLLPWNPGDPTPCHAHTRANDTKGAGTHNANISNTTPLGNIHGDPRACVHNISEGYCIVLNCT